MASLIGARLGKFNIMDHHTVCGHICCLIIHPSIHSFIHSFVVGISKTRRRRRRQHWRRCVNKSWVIKFIFNITMVMETNEKVSKRDDDQPPTNQWAKLIITKMMMTSGVFWIYCYFIQSYNCPFIWYTIWHFGFDDEFIFVCVCLWFCVYVCVCVCVSHFSTIKTSSQITMFIFVFITRPLRPSDWFLGPYLIFVFFVARQLQ